MTHQPSKSNEDYVEEFRRNFSGSTNSLAGLAITDWLRNTIKAVREDEREEIWKIIGKTPSDKLRPALYRYLTPPNN